jgi:protein-disulfide isomerase
MALSMKSIISKCAAALAIAGVAAALTTGFAGQNARAEAGKKPFTADQEAAIRKLVKDYILKNPEIIAEALEELRRRREEEQTRAAARAVRENRAALLNSSPLPVDGNAKGNITIVEFFDYRCGYCKAVKSQLDAVVKADGNIRVVYKEFPILGEASTYASQAAIASRKQGK